MQRNVELEATIVAKYAAVSPVSAVAAGGRLPSLPKLQVGGTEERSFALATRLTHRRLATQLDRGPVAISTGVPAAIGP